MNKVLESKVRSIISLIRRIWPKLEGRYPFIAFSSGKDSLAMASIIYEALENENEHLTCLYSHHDLEYKTNLEYLDLLKERGFLIEIRRPFLEYFELINRGIGFLTLVNAWCIPLLIGTSILEWLQQAGAKTPRKGVMFRGISGGEYSHRFHSYLELNKTLNLPCFNPMLEFTTEEIIELVKNRYGLPLNPIYQYMNRTYCICCYTLDERSQAYCRQHYPEEYNRYYRQIEEMIFDSGLITKVHQDEKFKTREEKLYRHGFAHWHRIRAQNLPGAIKQKLASGELFYHIRNNEWINTKHLAPVRGKWIRKKDEIRFWNVPERVADTLVKRMINCLDCGFCVVECFQCRRFDRKTKTLKIEGCIQCGRCLSLKYCMGWRHRFWRRIIVDLD